MIKTTGIELIEKEMVMELEEKYNNINPVKLASYHAGINLGNLFTKAVGERNRKEIFLTSANEISEADALMMKNDDSVIKVNNKYYIVGENADSADTIERRDKNVLVVSACYSVAKLMINDKKMLTKTGNFKYKAVDVQAVLGLCIDEYKQQKEKDNLRELFDDRKFEICYMGHEFILNYNIIDIMAEGYAHYQMNYEKYDGYRKVFFLDAGSKTWDMCMIVKGKLRNPLSLENSGTLFLMRDIKKAVKPDVINIEDIEIMLREGSVKVGKKEYRKEQFKDIINRYADNNLKEANQSYDNELSQANLLVAFGGGITLVEDKLREFFDKDTDIEILDEPVFANAIAYYEASYQEEE